MQGFKWFTNELQFGLIKGNKFNIFASSKNYLTLLANITKKHFLTVQMSLFLVFF